MKPYAHPNQRIVRPGMPKNGELDVDSSGKGLSCTGEDYEKGIALGIDFVPAMGAKNRAEKLMMSFQHLRVSVAQVCNEASRALDVRKEEGQSTRWKMRHRQIL